MSTEQLRLAFDLVTPDKWGGVDWKAPITAVLSDADLATAGVTLDDVIAGVEFMTSTKATVERTTWADTGIAAYVVKIPGYRAGPAN